MPIEMTMRDTLIYAKFLQKGDVFRTSNGRPGAPNISPKATRTILEIRDVDDDELFGESNPPVKMHIKTDQGAMVLKEGTVVELLHRPWVEGATWREMCDRVYGAVARAQRKTVGTTDRPRPGSLPAGNIVEIREKAEEYELGLPYAERAKAVDDYNYAQREKERKSKLVASR